MVAVVAMTMVVAFAVVLAVDGGVIGKASRCKVGCCLVGLALYAAVEADARFLQGILCACADAAADQHIDVFLREQRDQSAVAGPVVLEDAGWSDCPVGHLIEFELLTAAKVLEDLTVVIGDCQSHRNPSFLHLCV